MRTLSVYTYSITRMFGYYPHYLKAMKLLKEGKEEQLEKEIIDKYVYKATTNVLKRAGTNLDVKGYKNLPKNEPYVLICNHQGNFDALVLMNALKSKRFGFIAKKEIKKVGILAIWMEMLGCVFIDRKSPRDAIKGLEKAADYIRNGGVMAFFPEGTRSRSSNVGQFKTGVFKVIEKTKVKVVPVAIDGTYKVMEANGGKIKPANVTLTICKPIETKDYVKEDFKKLPELTKSIIIENMRKSKELESNKKIKSNMKRKSENEKMK